MVRCISLTIKLYRDKITMQSCKKAVVTMNLNLEIGGIKDEW